MLSRAFQCTRSLYIQQRAYIAARTYASITHGRNGDLIQLLNECVAKEERSPLRNGYKIRAFRNAIKSIQDLDRPLLDGADAKKVVGIGPGIARRIGCFLSGEEYVDTEAVKLESAKRARAIALLQSVPGIGKEKSAKLVDAGCTTIADLRSPKFYDELSPVMKYGVDHHEFLNKTVSRHQAELSLEFCRKFLRFEGTIHLMGDYRRGEQTLHCLEFLVVADSDSNVPYSNRMPRVQPTPHGTIAEKYTIPFYQPYSRKIECRTAPLLNKIIDPLVELGILSASPTFAPQKWRGWLRIPDKSQDNVWENRVKRTEGRDAKTGMFTRADFNFVPGGSKGAAFLVLTGDSEFIADIQTRANKLGMRLNEYGLWRATKRTPDSDNEWELVEGNDEEAILKEIGMEYIEPEKRNFSYVVETRKFRVGRRAKAIL